MRISQCLSPKRIVNPYTKELQYVPCGRCAACLKLRALRWVQRLEQERMCWKYTLFFTLTYAPEHLPYLDKHNFGNVLVNHDALHLPKGLNLVVDVNDHLFNCKDKSRESSWIARQKTIPYLSVYDVQCFIKRLRQYCNRYVKKYSKITYSDGKKENLYSLQEEAFIRYYVCGEYGETCYRPHYHGILFFNSPFQASYIQEGIAACWPYGFCNTSFVTSSASSYVASYLNSFADLPEIYRRKEFRPFSVCSKCPPLGTLVHNSETIREMFISAAPTMLLVNHSKSAFENVPLWRYYQDSLFPKITRFGEFSHFTRAQLYGYGEKFVNFREFYENLTTHRTYIPDYALAYFNYLMRDRNKEIDADDFGPVFNWYTISVKVCYQARIFKVSLDDYVTKIETYWNNVEQLKLSNKYAYEKDYVEEKKKSASDLLGIDRLFLESVLDCSLADISQEELFALSSHGIDLDKFFSEDDEVRLAYQAMLLPESTDDFKCLAIDADDYINKKSRTKRKNDYLLCGNNKDFIY